MEQRKPRENGPRRNGPRKNGPRRNNGPKVEKEFEERVVTINRVTKVVKGGRKFRFAALVVIGDKKGRVGFGTGIIAGGPVRAVVELAGYSDILSKCIGSRTPINMVRATMEGLAALKTAQQVAELRDKKVEEIYG